MNIEELRLYCLQKKGSSESCPFGESSLVYKVGSKMFALLMIEGELRINLKCEPLLAIELREHNEGVLPGYHMSKKHWNTIVVDKVHRDDLKEWIDNSYQLVADSLTLKEKIKYL